MPASSDRNRPDFAAHSTAERAPGFWETADIFLTLWTLATAMWQLLIVDKSMIGFAGVWMLPPILMIVVRIRAAKKTMARWFATIYLALMSIATLIAEHPSILPGFSAEHPANTDFAEKWNRLDVVSRRVISVDMAFGGTLMFVWLGYILFWRDLRMDRRFVQPTLSVPTCIFGLCVLWGLPALTLAILLVLLLTG